MDFLRRFAPCSCMRINPNAQNTNEELTISIKTSCCRKTKIINYKIDINNTDQLNDIKDIIEKIEMKLKSRNNSTSNILSFKESNIKE